MNEVICAIVHKDDATDYGIHFPRLKGPAFLITETLDTQSKAVIQGMLQGYIDSNGMGQLNPEPEALDNEYGDLIGIISCVVETQGADPCRVIVNHFQPIWAPRTIERICRGVKLHFDPMAHRN